MQSVIGAANENSEALLLITKFLRAQGVQYKGALDALINAMVIYSEFLYYM